MAERGFYVLAYDVADDRRRAKLARRMEELGARVQGSVFEAYLTEAELGELLQKVSQLLEPSEDSLRVYFLCAECAEKVRAEGVGERTPPPGLMLV